MWYEWINAPNYWIWLNCSSLTSALQFYYRPQTKFAKVMFLYVSVILSGGGRGYPSMHCRWYPSMPCSRSPGGGGVIQACLAGFQAHTQEESSGVWPGVGGLQADTQGGSWGVWPGGGLQAHTWAALGGCLLPGGSAPRGGVCSQGGVWRPSVMATAAGGTHPTEMHSCLCWNYTQVTDLLYPSLANWDNRSYNKKRTTKILYRSHDFLYIYSQSGKRCFFFLI